MTMLKTMQDRGVSDVSVYAPYRHITDIGACEFYHTMDLPGHGLVNGQWDLRGGEQTYLGGISFKGKRVLELGTASGFLCRYMESQGADVVGFDLAAGESWDFVPLARYDLNAATPVFMDCIERIKNGWWFCRNLFHSRARAVYGTVYNIPRQIGLVDISTFGSILLHLRDPFGALRSAARLTKETMVVTDVCPDFQPVPEVARSPITQVVPEQNPVQTFLRRARHPFRSATNLLRRTFAPTHNVVQPPAPAPLPPPVVSAPTGAPRMYFVPNFRTATLDHSTTWWSLSPEIIVEFLGVLGFESTVVTYHTQMKSNGPAHLFTVVGTRTQPLAA